MYTRWTKGLSEEHKKEFNYAASASYIVIKRLEEILEEELSRVTKERLDKDYDSGSWPYFQADCTGEERAYTKIKKLISNLRGK